MRPWAVVGLVWLTGIRAKTGMLHPNPAEILVVGGVVLWIETGRGDNGLARGKRALPMVDGLSGGRPAADDATRLLVEHGPPGDPAEDAWLPDLATGTSLFLDMR